MPPQTRHRSRSSVDHIFDLVEDLGDDQLQDLLIELDSTGTHVPVSKGVEFFDEQRRRSATRKGGPDHPLRPTPSFLNSPHEPVDWPRQKPRPVSGQQHPWRQSMRIVSTPYGNLSRHQTEPISPPLTASPPSSPPLSPPKSAVGSVGTAASPKRSVTAPVLSSMTKGASGNDSPTAVQVQAVSVSPESPVSPPRHLEGGGVDDDENPRPSLTEFGSFSFRFDGAADRRSEEQDGHRQQPQEEGDKEDERPVSPGAQAAPITTTSSTPPPEPTADFGRRINTMPLPHLASAPSLDSLRDLPRPSTSMGHDAAKQTRGGPQRSFRRISRPMFLSPAGSSNSNSAANPDALAEKLSAYLFGDLPLPAPAPAATWPSMAADKKKEQSSGIEEMLKEPCTPRSQFLFGKVERETPGVSGIFEVLTEG